MSYKIVIQKKGTKAGEISIETLDSTSCNAIEEVSQQYTTITSRTSINHGDSDPIYDSININ